MGESFRYAAFISYRHTQPDRKWAAWLHKSIETYRVPPALVKKGVRARVGKVFRDEEELSASADLSARIDEALQQSEFLIVVCSPNTPKSRWVNAEVERFRAMGRGDRILALLIEGEPKDSFPPALCEIRTSVVSAEGSTVEQVEQIEPLAADVRPREDFGKGHVVRNARLRLISTVLGVGYDDLRNREQQRRTRRLAAAASTAVVILLAMAALTAFALIQRADAVAQRKVADEQRVIAEAKQKEAEEQRAEADKQRAEAERRQRESEAVVDFINTDVFAGATPERMPDANVRNQIAELMLLPAAKVVGVRFKEQPLVGASVMEQVAESLQKLGRSADAEPLYKTSMEIRQRVLGEGSLETIFAIRNYAGVLDAMGRAAESEPFYRKAVESARRVIGPDDPETISATCQHAMVLRWLDRSAEAEPILRDALDRSRRVLGDDDIATIASISGYANILDKLNRGAEAEPYHREALERAQRVFPKDDTGILGMMNNHAGSLADLGRAAEAEPLLQNALERARTLVGDDDLMTIQLMNTRAFVLGSLGRLAEAEVLHHETLMRRRMMLGNDHPATISSIDAYARSLARLGRLAEAETFAREAVVRGIKSDSIGVRHRSTRAFVATHVKVLRALTRSNDAHTVAVLFGLPDPTTQPAATRPITAPSTQPVSAEQDAEIRQFITWLQSQMNSAAGRHPAGVDR